VRVGGMLSSSDNSCLLHTLMVFLYKINARAEKVRNMTVTLGLKYCGDRGSLKLEYQTILGWYSCLVQDHLGYLYPLQQN